MPDNKIIYKITNPSGSIYIGKTINLSKRLDRYKNLHCKSQINIYRSLLKYGFNSHEVTILHELPIDVTNLVLSGYEIFYIKVFRDAGFNLMNLTDGGEGLLGKKHSKETIDKMRLSAKGVSPAARAAALAFHTGRKMPEEQRRKIGDSSRGCSLSENHKRKISERKKGVVFSDTHKEKLSAAHKGKSPWNKGLSTKKETNG